MQAPRRLVVATKNPGKLGEVRAVVAQVLPEIEIVDDVAWPDVPESGTTLEENALIKARAVCAATGIAAVADDTGLEVEALGGSPGVHSARYAGPECDDAANRRLLLAELVHQDNRAARFRTVVAVASPGGEEITVEGILEGTITSEERGSGGFGYDPIFEVEGRTLAELGREEKNRLSHRGRALRALAGIWGR
jgi:XTP/dITP diphosphohydrolase